jgi:hypothetical protein
MSVYQEGHLGRGVGMGYGAHNDARVRKDVRTPSHQLSSFYFPTLYHIHILIKIYIFRKSRRKM